MKIRIRNVILLAAFQDLLVLLCVAAMAGSAPTHKTRVWVTVNGVSHHFVPATERATLNQQQHTLGIEITHGHWAAQVSHMTDSFGCSSNEVAVTRRWRLFGGREVSGGLMLGAVAVHRCSGPAMNITQFTRDNSFTLPPGASLTPVIPPGDVQICSLSGSPTSPGTYCTVFTVHTAYQPPQATWQAGIIPGAYLDVGSRVRVQFTLIQSPWTGHHLVAYAQVLFRVATFQ